MKAPSSFALLLLVACATGRPAPRVIYSIEGGPLEHTVRIVEEDGAIVRDVEDLEHVYAARVTPAETLLATLCEDDGRPLGLAEMDREGRVLWRYEWPPEKAGIARLRASHALANGNVLIAGVGERGEDGRLLGAVILEMDRAGTEIRAVRLGPLQYLGAIRPLDHGVLVAGEGVFELAWDGAKRFIVPPSEETQYYDVLPLPSGNYIAGETAQRLVEISPDGSEVWSAWHEKPVFLQQLADGRLLVGG